MDLDSAYPSLASIYDRPSPSCSETQQAVGCYRVLQRNPQDAGYLAPISGCIAEHLSLFVVGKIPDYDTFVVA